MTDPLAVVVTTASDAELIAAARAGDAKAYGALYERHAEAAKRLARQIVRRPADVDDVVAETFAKVLSALRRGAGPSEAFRPYLLTAVRRVAFDHVRGQREQIPTDEADLPDPGEPFIDPALASLERSLVARAFRSLPERWSAVLWHTEIEQARAAEVALLLGITPNGVAALSYRAREGLRQAYLQMHLSSRAREECVPVAGKLGAHVRGGLSSREAYRVDSHLRGCGDCLAAHAELTSINGALRNVLGPAVLGGQTAAYLAHGGQAVATASSFAALASRALRWALSHRPVLPVTAGVALTAAMLPVATLVYQHPAIPRPGGSLPRGTAPSGGAPVARASGGPRSSPAPTSPAQPSPRASGTPATGIGPGAAIALADAQGLAAVTLRAVGQRVGVTAMALYGYFPDTDSLLDAMADRWRADLEGDGRPADEVARRMRRGDLLRRAPELLLPFRTGDGMHDYPDGGRRAHERTMFTGAGGAGTSAAGAPGGSLTTGAMSACVFAAKMASSRSECSSAVSRPSARA